MDSTVLNLESALIWETNTEQRTHSLHHDICLFLAVGRRKDLNLFKKNCFILHYPYCRARSWKYVAMYVRH
jgi:hypothetical protein